MQGSPIDLAPEMVSMSEIRPSPIVPQLVKESSRVDVELLMSEFREELGPSKWDDYRDALSRFLMGKLSRAELVLSLKETVGLRGPGMRSHNTLIQALLANSCREPPPGTESNLTKWSIGAKAKARSHGFGSSNNRVYQEILSLPVRERRRIKDISKEALAYMKQPLLKPLLPTLIETRRKLLPHIPQDTSRQSDASAQQHALKTQELNSPNPVTKAIAASKLLNESKKELDPAPGSSSLTSAAGILYDPVLNLHPAHTSGPLTWKQDIVQAFDTPLDSESHELSDDSHLAQRMLGTALEHGLVSGIGVGSVDVMQAGVEAYLRQVLEQLVQTRYRSFSPEDPLTAEDLCVLADTRPTDMGEVSGPLYRLRMTFLREPEGPEPPAAGVSTDAEDSPRAEHAEATAGTKRYAPLEIPLHANPTVANRQYTRHQREIIEREIKQRALDAAEKTEEAGTPSEVPRLKLKIPAPDQKAEPVIKTELDSPAGRPPASHGGSAALAQASASLQGSLGTVDAHADGSEEVSAHRSLHERLEDLRKQMEGTQEVWVDSEPPEFFELKTKMYEQQQQGLDFVSQLL